MYPTASSTTITETERPTPKRIPVHVTDRNENMTERNNRETQNRQRQLNINRNPAPPSVVLSKKKTLIIGNSILNKINLSGIVKGVQKTFEKWGKSLILLISVE